MPEEKKDSKEPEKESEEKVEELFLLQAGFSFATLKEMQDFCHGIQEFVQYLGTNQYYSDLVNKKVFLLTLDVDACLLKMQLVHLKAAELNDFLAKAIAEKKKPELNPGELKEFLASLEKIGRESTELHKRALDLTEDIRKDYKLRQ